MAKSKGGVRRLGAEDGKIRYEVRLLGRDPVTKRLIVDTLRKVYADDIADAHRQRKQLTAEAVALKLGQSIGGGRLRFAEAVERWLETVTRYATNQVWKSYGKRASKDFGERWLDKITGDELQRWLNRQDGARSTVAGIRMMLVNLYEWAIDNGHAARPNPAEGTKLKRKRHTSDHAAKLAELETPKKRSLLADELSAYLAAHREKHPETYPIVYTMLCLGTRYSEVSALKRSDVDWRTGEVIIRRAQVRGHQGPPKADKPRRAALAASCLELLRGHVAACGESVWLFPRPAVMGGPKPRLNVWGYSAVWRHVKASMAAAGVRTDNATHLFRHTLKSLMEGEVPDAVLRKVIGHSSEAVHAIYGDAKVLEFARSVERELSRSDKAGRFGNPSGTPGQGGGKS